MNPTAQSMLLQRATFDNNPHLNDTIQEKTYRVHGLITLYLVGREAYLVHGGHVGAPLMAALDADAGCSTISPGVEAAHAAKHL